MCYFSTQVERWPFLLTWHSSAVFFQPLCHIIFKRRITTNQTTKRDIDTYACRHAERNVNTTVSLLIFLGDFLAMETHNKNIGVHLYYSLYLYFLEKKSVNMYNAFVDKNSIISFSSWNVVYFLVFSSSNSCWLTVSCQRERKLLFFTQNHNLLFYSHLCCFSTFTIISIKFPYVVIMRHFAVFITTSSSTLQTNVFFCKKITTIRNTFLTSFFLAFSRKIFVSVIARVGTIIACGLSSHTSYIFNGS